MGWFADRYGPWALVAGASEGIGEAFANALAQRGLKLITLARREDKLRETSTRIAERHGVEVVPVTIDLADAGLLGKLEATVGEREIGTLVYNAAFSRVGDFFEQALDDHLRAIDVNCRAPLALCHTYGRAMRERGRGAIVLMGSMSSLQGSPRLATYAATKAFDRILAESLWGELRGTGVDVLACVAGATRTPGFEAVAHTAKGPVLEPEQVVEEALAALGWRPSMVPGFANKVAARILAKLPRRRQVLIMRAALGDDSGGSRED